MLDWIGGNVCLAAATPGNVGERLMNVDAGHVGWSVRLCSRFYSYRLWRLGSRPDTRARNSRNPNATGKLLSKNPTVEFH